MERGAVLSDCGLYRYVLVRKWGDGPRATFVMLNPSTADGSLDDPTIRRCVGFAKREGCGAMLVVNLFAYRATRPKDMADAVDPIGPENATYLLGAFATARDSGGPVIAAWGTHWMAKEQAKVVSRLIAPLMQLHALGVTQDGSPRHPLYVKATAPLVPWCCP
jgi:hypothetical protein